MTDKLKKHGWTISKIGALVLLIAGLISILESKTFSEAIAPWTSMPRDIAEIKAAQQAHNKEVDRKLNLLLSAQGILGIDEWARTNNIGRIAKKTP